MGAYQHKTNSGTLFSNDYKKTDRHPDHRGGGNIGGEAWDLAAWKKDDAISVQVSEPWVKGQQSRGESYNGRIAPYEPKDGEEENVPAYFGDVVVKDVTYQIRAWENEGQKGTYLSLRFYSDAEPQGERKESKAIPVDMDSIPF